MIKPIYLIFAVLMLASCNFQNIEIKGTAPGMDGSTVSIMDASHKIIYGANIQAGKFEIAQQPLPESGYYSLLVNKNKKGAGIGMRHYTVYLEPGKYNIAFQTSDSKIYPRITSSSALQNDLTIYQRFTDSAMLIVKNESDNWLAKLNDPKALTLSDKDYQAILANVNSSRAKLDDATITILADFVAKHPNNKIIPHAMANMYFDKDPVRFFNFYKKLDDNVKNSEEGKQVGDKLRTLTKLMPGSMAPAIAGQTPAGKDINIKELHKKLIVIAFWRSGGTTMEQEQYGLANDKMPLLDSNKVAIISVSFDTNRNAWLNSIKKSGHHVIQISDLKGDDSPNVNNWDISTLPNYYILDANGRILYNNLSYQALDFSVNQYLSKH